MGALPSYAPILSEPIVMKALPIVFQLDVHCIDCAQNIRRSLRRMFGAHTVEASLQTGMVVVHGGPHLDPWILKCFLQRFAETRHSRRHRAGGTYAGVTVINDGGRQRSHFEGIMHLVPLQPYYQYGRYDGGLSWYDYNRNHGGSACNIM